MLVDKCIEMIKSLPKSTRKQFVPIPESVKSIAHLLKAENKPLGQQLEKYLFALSGEKVHEDLWDIKKINPWYRASFKLMDENNQIIEVSKDLIELKDKYRDTFKNNLGVKRYNVLRETVCILDLMTCLRFHSKYFVKSLARISRQRNSRCN